LTASAGCLITLILQEPSNNVKMIVLERVSLLHAKHEHVLDELVMDILRVLASPDMEVRRKALGIALEMISSRNVEEVVGFLKKELIKTLDGQFEKVSHTVYVSESETDVVRAEPRVPPTPHPNDPHLRDQTL
jgi:coatomer subunit beta